VARAYRGAGKLLGPAGKVMRIGMEVGNGKREEYESWIGGFNLGMGEIRGRDDGLDWEVGVALGRLGELGDRE
jgi:hypothetical protein